MVSDTSCILCLIGTQGAQELAAGRDKLAAERAQLERERAAFIEEQAAAAAVVAATTAQVSGGGGGPTGSDNVQGSGSSLGFTSRTVDNVTALRPGINGVVAAWPPAAGGTLKVQVSCRAGSNQYDCLCCSF